MFVKSWISCLMHAMLILGQTSSLLLERLQAYKHAVGYLENYITETEKVEKAHAKEYEKILKVHLVPFIIGLGGIHFTPDSV